MTLHSPKPCKGSLAHSENRSPRADEALCDLALPHHSNLFYYSGPHSVCSRCWAHSYAKASALGVPPHGGLSSAAVCASNSLASLSRFVTSSFLNETALTAQFNIRICPSDLALSIFPQKAVTFQ